MSKLLQIILFIIANWSEISRLVSELFTFFDGDKEQVKECIGNLCDIAKEQNQEKPKTDKPKKLSLLAQLILKYKRRHG